MNVFFILFMAGFISLVSERVIWRSMIYNCPFSRHTLISHRISGDACDEKSMRGSQVESECVCVCVCVCMCVRERRKA